VPLISVGVAPILSGELPTFPNQSGRANLAALHPECTYLFVTIKEPRILGCEIYCQGGSYSKYSNGIISSNRKSKIAGAGIGLRNVFPTNFITHFPEYVNFVTNIPNGYSADPGCVNFQAIQNMCGNFHIIYIKFVAF